MANSDDDLDAELGDTLSPPPPEERPDEDSLDTELRFLPSADHEVFFRLGQIAGPGKTLREAIRDVVFPLPEWIIPSGGVFPAYSGSWTAQISDTEMAAYMAEQKESIVVPTHRNPMTHAGTVEDMADVSWYSLTSLETHPLHGKLRDCRGRKQTLVVQTAPVMAFLSLIAVPTSQTPDWVNRVVFVSEPFTASSKPVSREVALTKTPSEETTECVQFVLGYTREDPPDGPMPEWVKSRGKSRGTFEATPR